MLLFAVIALFVCPIAVLYSILSPAEEGGRSRLRRTAVWSLYVLGFDIFFVLVSDPMRYGYLEFFGVTIRSQLGVMVYGLILWGAWRGAVRLWRRWSPADPAEQQSGVPS